VVEQVDPNPLCHYCTVQSTENLTSFAGNFNHATSNTTDKHAKHIVVSIMQKRVDKLLQHWTMNTVHQTTNKRY